MRMTARFRVRLGALLVVLAAATGLGFQTGGDEGAHSSASQALSKLRYPKTVVVVRHAEKATDDPRDPTLSEAGVERATDLATLLGASEVTHLFASEYKRTRLTLAPLAALAGADIHVVSARQPEGLVSALHALPRGSVAVVAGHSNTVPDIVARLGGEVRDLVESRGTKMLDDSSYDRAFVVTLWGQRDASSVLELRYGD